MRVILKGGSGIFAPQLPIVRAVSEVIGFLEVLIHRG